MGKSRTLGTGIYLRGDDQIQIKFSSKRLSCRITISYQIPKYTKAEKDRAAALRGQLTAAADNPGTNDALLIEHLDNKWLDRLGISRAQDLTLQAAVDRHMAMYVTAGKNTRTSAQRECNALVAYWGAEKRLSTFANEYTLIREWILRNQSAPWRKKTGGRLKMLLEEIRRDGVIETHPLESNTWWKDMQPTRTDRAAKFKAAMAPTESKNESKAFTAAEVEAILAVDVQRPDEMALIATGFATGMRIGELFALSAEDVNFEAGTIDVNFNWSSGEFGLPKFDKQRVIPLPPELEFLLRRQVKKYKDAPVSLTVDLEGEKIEVSRTFLFRNSNEHENAQRAKLKRGQDHLLFNGNDLFRKCFWRPMLEKAGVRYLPPYSMRHTYATNMINVERLDYRDVAAFMGHADPETTRNRYVQARDDDQLARIEKFRKAAKG